MSSWAVDHCALDSRKNVSALISILQSGINGFRWQDKVDWSELWQVRTSFDHFMLQARLMTCVGDSVWWQQRYRHFFQQFLSDICLRVRTAGLGWKSKFWQEPKVVLRALLFEEFLDLEFVTNVICKVFLGLGKILWNLPNLGRGFHKINGVSLYLSR